MQQRIKRNEFLATFDGPDGNVSLGARKVTTTTLQALYWMNSEFVHEQTAMIATRESFASLDTTGKLKWAYWNIFGRAPTETEAEYVWSALRRLKQPTTTRIPSDEAWAALLRGMLSSNAFVHVD